MIDIVLFILFLGIPFGFLLMIGGAEEIGMPIFLISGLGLMVGAVFAEMNASQNFMAECLKDRKEYECVSMWRGGQRSTVTVTR